MNRVETEKKLKKDTEENSRPIKTEKCKFKPEANKDLNKNADTEQVVDMIIKLL